MSEHARSAVSAVVAKFTRVTLGSRTSVVALAIHRRI